jgi:hypothetical protein
MMQKHRSAGTRHPSDCRRIERIVRYNMLLLFLMLFIFVSHHVVLKTRTAVLLQLIFSKFKNEGTKLDFLSLLNKSYSFIKINL